MDAVSVLQKEFFKVESKHKELQEGLSNMDDLIAAIENNQDLDSNWYLNQVKTELTNISVSHKDWHGSISRFGKVIDKQLTENVSFFTNRDLITGRNSHLLHQLICEHFLRQGNLDLVEKFITESGHQLEECRKRPFVDLNQIVGCLKRRDLEPALRWCENNRPALKKRGSSLEFMLHRLNFITLIKERNTAAALTYAQILGQFVDTHKKQLQRLMGSLLYISTGIENSTYNDLMDPQHWVDICEMFTKEACSLMGLSKESPLSITVDAGCKALPALNSIRQVMEAKQLWGLKDELPCEVDLGPSCQFHSLFACPILRAQCTKSNPPMRLECGHVISNDALKRLAISNKVKCPYCPQETSPSEAKQIYF
ncbi:E3 ubiquitin-protein ligase RMND5A-like isoform X3 [Bolinopsis microptera]|uniref:E3 ubiquitin-protein ligase RMND5A-like n=1 Tax=Bolinopsis microptera TaxID=2820187 RepID=UPI00307A6E23